MLTSTPYLLKQRLTQGPHGNGSLSIRSKEQTCPRHLLVASGFVCIHGYSLTSGSGMRLQTYSYQSIATQASSEYQTSAWLKYYKAFCYFASKTTDVNWDTINHHLWAQCFTGCAEPRSPAYMRYKRPTRSRGNRLCTH